MLWCPLRFPRKNVNRFVLTPVCFVGLHVLSMLFVFIFVYRCLTRFSYHMVFVSFNSNTTGVTHGTGTAYPSGALSSTPDFNGVRVARSLVFCVMFCRSLYVLLSFFFWPLCCLSFDLRILITPLVSSNSSSRRR